MGQDSDDLVSLPAPPPPNPAARRSAIDTALRKFDGIEDAAPVHPSPWQWAATHRRATGGLVTAALIALVSVPAIQVALRDQPKEAASEEAVFDRSPSAEPAAPDAATLSEPPAAAEREESPAPAEPEPHAQTPAENRTSLIANRSAQTARIAPPAGIDFAPPAAPLAAAPPLPPPPPPPPPAAAQREAKPHAEAEAADMADSQNIVVTGSRVRRQNLESAVPVTVITDPYAEFLGRLQSAFRVNNRRAVIGLIGFPLAVHYRGETRTYRSASDVERDYDRIFTSGVRASVLNRSPGAAEEQKEAGPVVMGPTCSRDPCKPDSPIRIREVRP